MKNPSYRIIKSSASLKKNYKNSSIDTECLFGESFEVESKKGLWCFGKCREDNYKGWIKSNVLGNIIDSSHIVSAKRSFVFRKPDIKSEMIIYLPLRSKIKVIEKSYNWAKLDLSLNKNKHFGYILSNHIIQKQEKKQNWVKYAELFLHTPYRWGGRNSIGIDCSALLQLSKSFSGECLPRDSDEQFEYFKKAMNYNIIKDPQLEKFSRGNIVFWKGHVAIVINEKKLIHASAYHGIVKLENIKKVIKRLNKPFYLVKEKIC